MPPGNLRDNLRSDLGIAPYDRLGVGRYPQMPPGNLCDNLRSDLGKRSLPAAGGRGREGSVSAAAPLPGRRVSRPGKGIRGKADCLPTMRSPFVSGRAKLHT